MPAAGLVSAALDADGESLGVPVSLGVGVVCWGEGVASGDSLGLSVTVGVGVDEAPPVGAWLAGVL